MLRHLSIKNYALIDQLDVAFGTGLNIITGETGAGKSIIIDALGLILGERADATSVRQGTEKAVVEGMFAVSGNAHVGRFLAGHDIDAGEELILRREVNAKGQGRAFINDTPATLAVLKEAGELLVDLHGQHEHQSLLRPGTHLALLDEYGRLGALAGEFAEAYTDGVKTRSALRGLRSREAGLRERRSLVGFQLGEIDAVGPEPDEEQRLERELTVLENSEKLFSATERLYRALYDGENALHDGLVLARNELEDLAAIDPSFADAHREASSAAAIVDELAKFIQSYNSRIEFNPGRLEEIRDRLGALTLLRKKYGGSLQAVIAKRAELAGELSLSENFEEEAGKLEEQLAACVVRASEIAGRLSNKRREVGKKVAAAVVTELRTLGIPNAAFEAVVTNRAGNGADSLVRLGKEWFTADATGMDVVEFHVSANAGQDPRPLTKVASGGRDFEDHARAQDDPGEIGPAPAPGVRRNRLRRERPRRAGGRREHEEALTVPPDHRDHAPPADRGVRRRTLRRRKNGKARPYHHRHAARRCEREREGGGEAHERRGNHRRRARERESVDSQKNPLNAIDRKTHERTSTVNRLHRYGIASILLTLAFVLAAAAQPSPKKVPKADTLHGDIRVDDYAWLRQKEDPGVIQYLEAENAFTDSVMKPTEELQEILYKEMVGRIKETDMDVPYPYGGYLYYSRTEEGKQYGINCRKKDAPGSAEEIILERNELAKGLNFMAVGAFTVSPDQNLLAFSMDTSGYEAFDLMVKDLRTGAMLADRIPDVADVVWATDGKTFFYSKRDAARRPYRLYRHTLGADPASDALVLEEKDELYNLFVGRTRSDAYILAGVASSTTSEFRYVPADRPAEEFKILLARETDHEYGVDHTGGFFYIVSNKGAKNFRMVKAPVADPSSANWTEVIAQRADVTIEGVEAFKDYLVVSERKKGLPSLRVMDLASGSVARHRIPRTGLFRERRDERHVRHEDPALRLPVVHHAPVGVRLRDGHPRTEADETERGPRGIRPHPVRLGTDLREGARRRLRPDLDRL